MDKIPAEQISILRVEPLDEIAQESLTSWERTINGSLGQTYASKEDFLGSVEAIISNVEHYAHPQRPGTDEGDRVVYDNITKKLKVAVTLFKEGYNREHFNFLLNDMTIGDENFHFRLGRHFDTFGSK